MTDHMTIDRFESALRDQEPELLDIDSLTAIRQDGARRRTRRRTLSGLATVAGAVVVAAALGVAGLGDGGAPTRAEDPDTAGHPTELSPLQERILREIPGARQTSEWQVELPDPGVPQEMETPLTGQFAVVGDPIPTGAATETGITSYPRSAFPRWLFDEIDRIEREELGDGDSRPVGSTLMGIEVASGQAELACVSFEGGECGPALVRRSGGELFYEWGFGTDDFLKPGTGMEVFAPTFEPGAHDAPELVIAGLPGAGVTRVEFVNTLGEVTEGRVTHALVDDASILWAEVPGALQRVVAYDANGDVVDDHRLRDCSGGSDCEVR